MSKLVQELEKIIRSREWIPHWKGSEQRIRCFLHILNLVSQSLLVRFDAPTMKTDVGHGGSSINVERESGNINAQAEAGFTSTGPGAEEASSFDENENDGEILDDVGRMMREGKRIRGESTPVCSTISKVSWADS